MKKILLASILLATSMVFAQGPNPPPADPVTKAQEANQSANEPNDGTIAKPTEKQKKTVKKAVKKVEEEKKKTNQQP